MNKYLQPQKYKLAYQSNNIIRTALDMSILQYRIYQQALSELHTSMSEFPTTLIPASSFIPWLGNGESYEAVHAAVSGLAYKVLDLVPIKEKSTRTHKIPLMAEVEFVTGERMIRLTFNKKAAPYLLQIKDNYTITEIEPALRLKSANAMHLYHILHSYDGKGKGKIHLETISLDQLKEWLLGNTTQYPIFTEFNRRVMKPILAEFKAIGYAATWKPSKTGKKTTGITFTIPRVRHHLASSDAPDIPPLPAAPATPAPTAAGEPAPLMRVNKDEHTSLAHLVQTATAQLASPAPVTAGVHDLSSLPAADVTTRITTRLGKLKLTAAQINQVIKVLGNEQVQVTKLMKVTYPLLSSYESTPSKHPKIGAETVNLLKTEFPLLYQAKELA